MHRSDSERTTDINTSASDSGQPGLWPLTETGTRSETARTSAEGTAARPQHRTSPPRQRRTAATQPPSPPSEIENLWGIDEVGRYLGVSKDTIYGWRKTNYGPPAMKIGKHLRWRPERVLTWAEEHERPVE